MSTTAVKREGFGVPEMHEMHGEARDEARRALRLACLAVIGICGAGLIAVQGVGTIRYAVWSLFFEQFAAIERVPLLLVAGFACITLFALARPRDDRLALPQVEYRRWIIALLAAFVVAVALAGIRWVFHGYMLADDEYSAWFQANVFAHGRLSATVPRFWCRWIGALTPTSIYASSQSCSWRLTFLPLHSLVQAPFIALGLGRLGVPLLSGASVLLIASIARKLWPDRPVRAYVAAGFMVLSTQVLFMSMTMFSMPTHLCFSLLWLWLYVDDRRWANMVMPWVGVLALGVHSPFPHALLIPPFVLRYLWRRRFAMFAYVSAVYAVGLMYWYGYLNSVPKGNVTTVASVTSTAGVARSLFHLPSVGQGLVTSMHLALVPSWNGPIVIILAILAMLSWRHLDDFSRDATLSVALIIAARLLMPTPQGEGWGYRFIYDGLACLALLCAIGAEVLARAVGRRRAVILIGISVALSLFAQIPVRAIQVRGIVGPFQAGYDWMTALNYDAVVYPTALVKWGRQLVRNDPFLTNRPKILSETELTPELRHELLTTPSLRVLQITRDSLLAHHFPLSPLQVGGSLITPY